MVTKRGPEECRQVIEHLRPTDSSEHEGSINSGIDNGRGIDRGIFLALRSKDREVDRISEIRNDGFIAEEEEIRGSESRRHSSLRVRLCILKLTLFLQESFNLFEKLILHMLDDLCSMLVEGAILAKVPDGQSRHFDSVEGSLQ